MSARLDAAEEAALEAALLSEWGPPAAPAAAAPPPPAPHQRAGSKRSRDHALTLDAAIGSGSWSTSIAAREVDFVEERVELKAKSGNWAASVSIVLRLSTKGGDVLHDETGSGRSEYMPSEEAAVAAAEQAAVDSGLARLAKRYGPALHSQGKLASALTRPSGGGAGRGGRRAPLAAQQPPPQPQQPPPQPSARAATHPWTYL